MNKTTQKEIFYGRTNEDGKTEFKKINPLETTITMTVDDIVTKEIEVEVEEKSKQAYDKLLLKIYWFLKGINHNNVSNTVCELLNEIEGFIDNE